ALLRAGNTKAPLDILRQAGAPVEGNITGDLVNYYNGLVNELDRLLRSNGRI
ncbi:MAG: oligoendopeptidase F family protein, partial [Clostridiales bacterium]|nr:oligoendopeptidase F family protein [Clostridiales bacterium]